MIKRKKFTLIFLFLSLGVVTQGWSLPSVAITSPTNGATVSGTISILGTASDPVAVSRVEVFVDGGFPQLASGTTTWTFSLNTFNFYNGGHIIYARAYDPSNNFTTTSIGVFVNNTDTLPPIVYITSPANGATVSGTITILGTASDNVSVSRVEMEIDSGPVQIASGTNNWSLPLDTFDLTEGTHTLLARAVDTSLNISTASVSVIVNNATDATPPSVPTGLTSNTVSCSQINLAWNASTDTGGSGLKGYNVYRNTLFLKQVLASNTSTSDTGLAASTNFSYAISAIDNANNESARSTAVSATTSACPDTTLPSVAITSPANGATVSGSISITGIASDDVAVSRVEIQIDAGTAQTATGTANWSLSLNTLNLSDGNHTILARAVDTSNNSNTHSITVTVQNAGGDSIPPTVNILQPTDGSRTKRKVYAHLSGSDNSAVSRVELWVNGTLAKTHDFLPALPSFDITLIWKAPVRGVYTLQAKAYDTSGNQGISSPITITVVKGRRRVHLRREWKDRDDDEEEHENLSSAANDAEDDDSPRPLMISSSKEFSQTLAFDPEVQEASIMDLRGRTLIHKTNPGGGIVITLQETTNGGLHIESGLLLIQMRLEEGSEGTSHKIIPLLIVK